MQHTPSHDAAHADAEKRQAAFSSVIWSLFLTVLKLVAGVMTNSLGLLSEALHSALDLVAAGITYFAVRVAARPADRNHPYGYGKVENLSALVETVLLLATCVWIVYEAIDRLFFSSPIVTPSWWGIAVIIVSIVVDISRARMLKRVAKKHNSQALEADALHFSTDILSSFVVLAGLLAVWAASLMPPGPLRDFLEKTDAIAALMVSVIVVWVGVRLCRRAVNVLLDGGGRAHSEAFEQSLTAQLPAYTVRKLRVRESGAAIFADLTLTAPGELSLEAAHDIAGIAEDIAHAVMPGADVTVHVEPAAVNEPTLLHIVHTVAVAHGMTAHSLDLYTDEAGDLHACLHVEAPHSMPLREAHTLVDGFERSLAARIGVTRIFSHIEPDRRRSPHEGDDIPTDLTHLETAVHEALAEAPPFPAAHELEVRQLTGLTAVSFHCTAPGNLNVAAAHDLSTRMERRLRRLVPGIDRVTIHMEPGE